MSQLYIATRDASWNNHPNVWSVKRFHAVIDGSIQSPCGIVVLDVDAATPYDLTLPLCRKAACRKVFASQR